MPRKLPWLTAEKDHKKSHVGRGSQVEAKQEVNNTRIPRKNDGLEDSFSGASTLKRRASRTPSTSPPPAPPREEYMRDGWDKDDAWMMVEDEFYAVAQSFTSHLHWQEYKRLKDKAKAEKAASRKDTTTDRRKRTELQLRLEAAELRAKHVKALTSLSGDTNTELDLDKEDDPWVGTTLYGLMTSSRKPQKALVGLEKVKSSTRAAAGYSQLPSKGSEGSSTLEKGCSLDNQNVSDEDDDLDTDPRHAS